MEVEGRLNEKTASIKEGEGKERDKVPVSSGAQGVQGGKVLNRREGARGKKSEGRESDQKRGGALVGRRKEWSTSALQEVD